LARCVFAVIPTSFFAERSKFDLELNQNISFRSHNLNCCNLVTPPLSFTLSLFLQINLFLPPALIQTKIQLLL